MVRLMVTEDLAGAATQVFLDVAPRLVALAGGSTPRAFYERLAEVDHPWHDTDVLLTDERCVPPEHPDANFGMIHAALLSKVPARVHRLAGELCDPEPHDRDVRAVLERSPLELAVLGLGADGHTASLFPDDPVVQETERAVVRVEGHDHPRLTLTVPVLSGAGVALFLVAGQSKRRALRRLLDGDPIPAARIRAERVVVVADRQAAPQR